MKAAVCFVIAGMVGCSADTGERASDPVLHGDTTFTEEERALVEAANTWMAYHRHREPVHIAWDAAHVHGMYPGEWSIQKRSVESEGAGGMTDLNANVLYLNICCNPFLALAAHEFGHFYGIIEHVSSDTVMNPIATRFVWGPEEESR